MKWSKTGTVTTIPKLLRLRRTIHQCPCNFGIVVTVPVLLVGCVMRYVRYFSCPLLFIALACLPWVSYAQMQKPQFKVQVNLVSIDVEVLDRQGKPVEMLNRDNFLVKESGAPVEISSFARLSDASISLVVSLDTAFMPQANLAMAKNAISLLIHLLKPHDEICLYTFDQRDAYLEQDFTRDRTKLVNALENIGVLSRSRRPGKLARSFADPPQAGLGIDIGLAATKKASHQRKALLLIRDLVENLGPGSLDHLQESGCTLIALGFSEKSKNQLTLIHDESGTEQLILGPEEGKSSDENGNITELCHTIAHLLSSRYNITYHTSSPEVRGPRQIEVLVPGHDYRIFARRSYVAPSR